LRALFPKVDIEKICLHNSKLSYPIFGRSIATMAEIIFILLNVLILAKTGMLNKQQTHILYFTIVIIIIAQMFSWTACLTGNNKWSVIEESLWLFVVIIFLILSSQIYIKTKSRNSAQMKMKNDLSFWICSGSLLYICFLLLIDIPMYIKRSNNNQIINENMNLNQMIKDMSQCKKYTSDFNIWKDELLWQSLYFGLGSAFVAYYVKWNNKYSKI
jgi:hypothetical protein